MPKVAYLDGHAIVIVLHLNRRLRAAGMAMHVREALLHDTKHRDFGFFRKPADRRIDLQIDGNLAALGEAGVPVVGEAGLTPQDVVREPGFISRIHWGISPKDAWPQRRALRGRL